MILCLHVVMKTTYNFPENSELPQLILPVKTNWLTVYSILICGFQGGNKILAVIRGSSLAPLVGTRFCTCSYTMQAWAAKWACSQAILLLIITSWRQVYCWWYGTTFSSPLISIRILRRMAPDTADLSVLFSGENKHASISEVWLYIFMTTML